MFVVCVMCSVSCSICCVGGVCIIMCEAYVLCSVVTFTVICEVRYSCKFQRDVNFADNMHAMKM